MSVCTEEQHGQEAVYFPSGDLKKHGLQKTHPEWHSGVNVCDVMCFLLRFLTMRGELNLAICKINLPIHSVSDDQGLYNPYGTLPL